MARPKKEVMTEGKSLGREVTLRFLQAMRTILTEAQINEAETLEKTGKRPRRLTKSKLAMILGEYPQNISKWENGDRNVTIENCVKICRLYGIDANWLMLGDGDMKPGDDILNRLDELTREIQAIKSSKLAKT